MITKIKKIKNLGLVFANYTWDASLPVFKKINLIYGWNGSGKTTLSRLFDVLGGGKQGDLEYEIEDDQNNKFKQGEPFNRKIRVFNQDYIKNNLKIIEGRANSISILLGSENKDLIEKIEADKALLEDGPKAPGKITLQKYYHNEKDRKSTERDGKFTEIARVVGAAIGGNALRDYRKPQAERDFAPLTSKEELSEPELEKYSVSAKQESLPQIKDTVINKITLEAEEDEVEIAVLLDTVNLAAKELLSKTVESEIIPRLVSNPDISDWVEQGIHLHSKHSSNVCEYCQQTIPSIRIQQLAKHFNEADKKLKSDLDLLIEKLEKVSSVIQAVKIPDRASFYTEFRTSFDTERNTFGTERQQFLQEVTHLIDELKDKKSKTTEAVAANSKPNVNSFSTTIDKINALINAHNKTTADFDTVKMESIKKIKLHYLSTIFDEVKQRETEVTDLGEKIIKIDAEIESIRKRIIENTSQVSSEHKACEVINDKLVTFLGHKELGFVPCEETEQDEAGKQISVVAYNIMRGDKPAVYLSEGEKTAIAFVYFIVHLGDQNFTVSDGIIVIDDPISSLDSNSLYQAFSFLKNAVKDGGQVFIFTHSFDFLKLLINWRKHDGGAGYYMVKNTFPADVRSAYISEMDKELYKYESEYHYLFKLLKQLRDEQDNTIAKAYPVPNIARKVWDTFLMFSVPNGETPYKKMEELKTAGFDAQKLDAIYKFTNDQSHITGAGFNPALVPEAKKVIKELFEMMGKISPEHYKILDRATT